jgi:nucleotide-binding universal stress UspA family protein
MRVLIPLDGSKTSFAAAREVAGEPWREGTEVRLLFALDLYPGGGWSTLPAERYAEIETIERARAKHFFDDAVALLKRGGFPEAGISTAVVLGSPKRVILDEAAAWGADLIAIGSYGDGAFKRALLGSVAQPVALHASCSVRLVRPKAR